MGLEELLVIAAGLSMDAFAIAVCKGLSVEQIRLKHCLICGVYFGLFQGLMPLAGYWLGSSFQAAIAGIDHWIVFTLLSGIGLNMIREACGEAEPVDGAFTPKAMLPLALATSIDALAVGVSFACLRVSLLPAVCFIGGITFLLSAAGVKLGQLSGAKCRARAEVFGGGVLILMGLKILLEHLGLSA